METLFANSPELIVAEVELIYKTRVPASNRIVVDSSRQAYNLLIKTWNPDKLELLEQSKLLLLNKRLAVLGLLELSTGGVKGTVVDIRHIFSAALKANATSIILAHNHPSGTLQPSPEDHTMTQKIKKAGDLIDIKLYDHLIITQSGYFSFGDEGLL